MPDDLYRLVYYSRNAIIGDAAALAAIASILAKSQVNNQRVGVTGALMFNSGCFAQVLEGSRSAVEDVFERIQQDERHGEVSLLAFDSAPARAFENWSMGFVGASIDDAARYGALVQDSGFDPARMTGDAGDRGRARRRIRLIPASQDLCIPDRQTAIIINPIGVTAGGRWLRQVNDASAGPLPSTTAFRIVRILRPYDRLWSAPEAQAALAAPTPTWRPGPPWRRRAS